MSPDSKSRRKVCPEGSLQLIQEKVTTENYTKRANSKKEAEKPLYLRRM